MVVVEFFIMRRDLISMTDEERIKHMNEWWESVEKNQKTPDATAPELKLYERNWPDWVATMIRTLPKLSWREKIRNFFLKIFGIRNKRERVRFDRDNMSWKVIFDNAKDADDGMNRFQTKYLKAIFDDADKKSWSDANRIQMSDMTEVNLQAIEMDEDLQEYHWQN